MRIEVQGGWRWLKDPLGALRKRMTPVVTLVVRRGSITFATEGRSVQLPARMYLADGIILAVGYPPEKAAYTDEIDVLDGANRTAEPLAKFIVHGLALLFRRRLMWKPVIRVDLERPSADQRTYWTAVAKRALATRVEFVGER